jgi:hypothetical protein
MAGQRHPVLAVVLAAALVGAAAALGCTNLKPLESDVGSLKAEVSSLKAEIAALKASVQKSETDLSQLKSSSEKTAAAAGQAAEDLAALKRYTESTVDVLKATQASIRGFDPNDPNHAKDSIRRGGDMTYQKISKGGIQFSFTAERMPPERTLYVLLNVAAPGRPAELVRVGELRTDREGRAQFSGTLARPPGVYGVGGMVAQGDRAGGPFTERVYLCFPSATVQVTS